MLGGYDRLDLAILKELRLNSKQSCRELSRTLKVHPNTLMQRIKRLEREKVITGYSANIDYRKVGYDLHAIVMVRASKKKSPTLWELASIAKIPAVQMFYATTGLYDGLAVVRVKDRDELVGVLQEIQKNPCVLRTNTFMVLSSFKQLHEFNPLEAMV